MARLLKFTTAVFLASCSPQADRVPTVITQPQTVTDSLKKTTDTPNHTFDTTIVINKQTFEIQTRDVKDDFVLLTVNSKLIDTLYGSGLLNLEFIDLNRDNNKDILISYIGNNPTNELYLFDPNTNSFRWLDGFINFPAAVQLKAYPKFYYSYHRAGCADQNWVSDLFTIQNFKTIEIGHIYGKSCEDQPKEIEIYKVTNNNEEEAKLIKKLPYTKNITDYCDKWNFIDKYWNDNYLQFK
jgi:hypothetical protein